MKTTLLHRFIIDDSPRRLGRGTSMYLHCLNGTKEVADLWLNAFQIYIYRTNLLIINSEVLIGDWSWTVYNLLY